MKNVKVPATVLLLMWILCSIHCSLLLLHDSWICCPFHPVATVGSHFHIYICMQFLPISGTLCLIWAQSSDILFDLQSLLFFYMVIIHVQSFLHINSLQDLPVSRQLNNIYFTSLLPKHKRRLHLSVPLLSPSNFQTPSFSQAVASLLFLEWPGYISALSVPNINTTRSLKNRTVTFVSFLSLLFDFNLLHFIPEN